MAYTGKAAKLFNQGYNCAQAVYLACRENDALSDEQAALVSGAFGGGVGGLEQTCGALCGAMMVLYERFAPSDVANAEQKAHCRTMTQALGAWFEREFTTTQCRELKALTCDHGAKGRACTEYVDGCEQVLRRSRAPFIVRRYEHGSPEYQAACALRQALLRAPLGLDLYQEDLASEHAFLHVGAFLGDTLVGTMYARPHPEEAGVAVIKQVAVDPMVQGLGAGRAMSEFALSLLYQEGYQRIVLHARESAIPFYQKLGFVTEGALHPDLGIPHQWMSHQR